MKQSGKNILIFVSVLVTLGVLFLLLFERITVPNVDNKKSFSNKSKQVFGLSAFTTFLSDKLGEKNVLVDYNFNFASPNHKGQAALIFGNDTYASMMNNPDLISYLQNGNDVYLLGDNVSVNYNKVRVGLDTNLLMNPVDTFYAQNVAYPFQCKLFVRDSFSTNMINILQATHVPFSEDDYVKVGTEGETDTSEALILADDTATIAQSIDTVVSEEEDYDSDEASEDSIIGEPILTFQGKPVFQKIKVFNAYIYVHSCPYLYTNIATDDANGYVAHFNLLLPLLKNKKVIITSDMAINGHKDTSPLLILLANRSLATAYYLALLIGLLYLIFGSKRIMKAIPLIEKVKNTSLEYTETLAKLYQKQGQPGRLVKKMEENFYFTMYKKFNVHRTDENYIQILAKKSKISESLIYSAVKYFEEIDKRKDCSDQQLEMLNNYLSNIEKQMNHGNKQ